MNDTERIIYSEIVELRKDVSELKVSVGRLKLIAGGVGGIAGIVISSILKAFGL